MALRRAVAARDYHEVVNFSFVEAAWEADFCGNIAPITLANPIASQMAVMRTSLIGGLVGNLAFNRKRQTERVRVFEIGRAFRKSTGDGPVPGFDQPLLLAGLCAGPASPEQWGLPARTVDFFDAKGDVEALFPPGALRFTKTAHPALHPGRAAAILLDWRHVGAIGELHPRWAQKYELGGAPVVFELDLADVLATPMPEFQEVSRYPAVVRDIALVVSQAVPVRALLDALESGAPAIVKAVQLFDLYQGKGLEPGQKSLAFRVVMQDTSRTLEDREVEAAVQSLVEAARREFGASLRG
jgi:phenylalanyl-tRNA synthetase beta chain